MQAERVFFLADQVYCQEAGNKRQTPEQSPVIPAAPSPPFLPLPAHTNTTLATAKANMCDLLRFTAPGGKRNTPQREDPQSAARQREENLGVAFIQECLREIHRRLLEHGHRRVDGERK